MPVACLRVFLTALCTILLSGPLLAASDTPPVNRGAAAARDQPVSSEEHPLITQLGDEDFAERREAEAKLRALGGDAFDLLMQARKHSDLEISTQAEYILHLINQDSWVQEGDPDAVRDLMSKYSQANPSMRQEIIDELAQLDDDTGIGALGRIAHFELAEHLAKYATLRIMEQRKQHADRVEKITELLSPEIGASSRDSTAWLELYLEQLQNSQSVLPQWLPLIDAEIAVAQRSGRTGRLMVPDRLLKFHVSLSEDLEEWTQLFESLRRRIDLVLAQTGESRRAIYPILHDVVENEQWEVMQLLEEHYQQQIVDDRLLLYQAAIGNSRAGHMSKALEVADKAFDFTGADGNKQKLQEELQERNAIAEVVADWGRHDWAEREWWYVTENAELTSSESLDARISLANWCLHDRNEDKEAAALLAEVCDAVDADEELKNALLRDNEARSLMTDVRRGREYFTACHLEQQKDFEGQKRHLELAYPHQNWLQDPDILIAMYRLEGADEDYRAKVRKRIRHAAKQVEDYIEKVEENLAERGRSGRGTATDAIPYNHWAWLISNTEGDFEKAIEYSKRSLEFSPGSASYLDTLGRCYYAAGDLENAVKYQRQAVEKQPMVRVMQRQLALFEKELAKQQKK